MKTLIRNNEKIQVENNKVNLYKQCGWIVLDDLFNFNSEAEKNESWLAKFVD